jgi:hypothetical protein
VTELYFRYVDSGSDDAPIMNKKGIIIVITKRTGLESTMSFSLFGRKGGEGRHRQRTLRG